MEFNSKLKSHEENLALPEGDPEIFKSDRNKKWKVWSQVFDDTFKQTEGQLIINSKKERHTIAITRNKEGLYSLFDSWKRYIHINCKKNSMI